MLMDQVFLTLRSVLIPWNFLGLQIKHWKHALSRAETHRLADPLVAILPQLVVSPNIPRGVGGGVNDVGGDCANCPGVFRLDRVGTVVWSAVLRGDGVLREVNERVFSISDLAERESKSRHGKLSVDGVVAGVADAVEDV